MHLWSRFTPLLLLVLGALTTAAAAQSSPQPINPVPLGPNAQLFPTPHGNIAAPEPQFRFQFPAHIQQPRSTAPAPTLLAEKEQKCFAIRSYRFAPNHDPAELPQLQGYTTCTPATGRELHPTTEPPAAIR